MLSTELYLQTLEDIEKSINLMRDALEEARNARYNLRYRYLLEHSENKAYCFINEYPCEWDKDTIMRDRVSRERIDGDEWRFSRWQVRDGKSEQLIKIQMVDIASFLEYMADNSGWIAVFTPTAMEERNKIAEDIIKEVFAKDKADEKE